MLSDRSLLGCTLSDFVDGNLFELAHRFFWISDATMGLFSVGFLHGSVFAGCSRTVRYELRVLVGLKRAHRGRPKVYTGPAAKVSWCDLARNYNGLSAIASVHVRLSKELQWFEQTPRCYGAI